ncbi:MBL fold metallo-hydrolase [Cohnella nanjingensis]|uniref:MBL fold metallo-hydrolase n=2 Tax=Cohnella nanjingensis TaxID=1387779 RepID=A0A7X0VE70_9BACL|nr:MBL fold metallo-hydrolase [Cohnella nanjingensis]
MRIAEGLEMLELTLGQGERAMTIHPVVLYDENAWVLIDTGMPGSEGLIRALVKQAGIPELPLQAIVLTHQDIDHIGGLPGFQASEPSPFEVYAHADDREAIDGKTPMIKFGPERASMLLPSLPDAVRISFENAFLHPTKPNVTRAMADGETLPFGGGLTVIHTPGHTPGHVCLYHHASKTLIAGDAMVAVGGELQGPRPQMTPELEQAYASLGKLKALDIETVICYHGGLARENVNASIEKLADRS